ncbi:hypothetical protein [Subtercola lobariae]|uniref:Uncharacterized protein n=1 Tax=Subtercola lobariae TaxID=1588641 RepID=A0A917B076_9MICO|nr:hypothetical protein [Subtercola lobariae]GGF11391.1 hypothetical protein GCM10011399_01540 [Subtercola lobariae]
MTVQRDDAWCKTATPEQRVAARKAGELDDYLGATRYRADAAESVRVATVKDRLTAEFYGMSLPQARAQVDSTVFASLRADMPAAKLALLDWVGKSTNEEVAAQEDAIREAVQ